MAATTAYYAQSFAVMPGRCFRLVVVVEDTAREKWRQAVIGLRD